MGTGVAHFLHHLNSIHTNINFAMEIQPEKLAYLGVLERSRENLTLGHEDYRKPTYGDQNLHEDSKLPRQKRAVTKTLSE